MRFIIAAVALLVTGSAFPQELSKSDAATVAARAKTEMVGMSKGELFVCAGVPEQIKPVDDYDFFTYKSHSRKSISQDLANAPESHSNVEQKKGFLSSLTGLDFSKFHDAVGGSVPSSRQGLATIRGRQIKSEIAQRERQAWLKEALVYLSCEATFVIKGDRIESVVYKGETGEPGAKDFMCAYIVENCVNGSR